MDLETFRWGCRRAGPRRGPRRRRVTAVTAGAERVGVLVMAHGTPRRRVDQVEAFYTRIRRGRPPTPELLAELTRPLRGHRGHLAPDRADPCPGPGGWPTHGSEGVRPRTVSSSGSGTKYVPTHHRGGGRPARGRGPGWSKMVGHRAHPAPVDHGLGRVLRSGGGGPRGHRAPRSDLGSFRFPVVAPDARPSPDILAERTRSVLDALRGLPDAPQGRRQPPVVLHRPQPPRAGGGRRRPLPRTRWPRRGPTSPPSSTSTPSPTVTWGDRLAECTGRTADPVDRARPTLVLRWDRVADERRHREWWSAPSGFVARTTSRCSTTSTSRPSTGPTRWGSPSPGPRRSTTTRRSCLMLADVVRSAADGRTPFRHPLFLTDQPTEPRPVIAVVGGGMAGLSAAWQLVRAREDAPGTRPSSWCSRRAPGRAGRSGRPSSAAGRWTWPPTPSWPAGPRPPGLCHGARPRPTP